MGTHLVMELEPVIPGNHWFPNFGNVWKLENMTNRTQFWQKLAKMWPKMILIHSEINSKDETRSPKLGNQVIPIPRNHWFQNHMSSLSMILIPIPKNWGIGIEIT